MKKRRQEAHPESVLLALRALGVDVHDPTNVGRALRQRQDELRQRGAEAVIVAWDGKVEAKHRAIPKSSKSTLVLEDGSTERWPPRRVLPPGYHRTTESLIISAPLRAHFPIAEKVSGVFAPLYALHSNRSRDAGDLTDMKALVDWTAQRGGNVVSTLPLLANFLDRPFEPSPYSPISRLFWNEFYIDPLSAPEFSRSPEAQAHLRRSEGRTSRLVDYRTTMEKKRRVLEVLARHSHIDDSRQFLAENREVQSYAEFRARTELFQRGWHDWPRNVDDPPADLVRYHFYVQWLVQQQLADLQQHSRARDCLLYLDLPLGLHRDSFDTWRYPNLFVKGMSGGAPPDPVFTTGQDWAFQPMHPEMIRRDGYRYVIAYIRNHLRYAKLLRIDHVMGLHRLYWIPEGLKGDRGLYVQYPAEEMYAILSLESHRAGAGIVGENLGMVPPSVNAAMKRHNVRQLYVAQYETAVSSKKAVLRRPPQGSVASLNTHDLFPFQGFLEETDIGERVKLGFVTEEEALKERKERGRTRKALEKAFGSDVFAGCTKFLAKSKAAIVLCRTFLPRLGNMRTGAGE
jgi:4-alpha-glucanotransferase